MNGFGERSKSWSGDLSPSDSDTNSINRGDGTATWKDFGMSMNAISLGFAATAVLISLFLLMAIFEHLIKPRVSSSLSLRSQNGVRSSLDVNRPQDGSHGKHHSSSKVESPSLLNFSVVMPGDRYPTYIAQPAPLPLQREGIPWPSHEHFAFSPP